MLVPNAAGPRGSRSAHLLASLVAFGAIGAVLSVGFPHAQAMGNAPSTCNNRYDGTITSFLVTYPGGTLDPIAHPNSTFTLQGDMTYNVTFTIHTQAQSSNGNALGGTTWYDQNVYGFYDGVCYPSQAGNSVGPNQDVSITMGGITHPCCSGYQVYQIDFATFSQLQQPVAFKINWQPALAPASVTSVTTSTSADDLHCEL